MAHTLASRTATRVDEPTLSRAPAVAKTRQPADATARDDRAEPTLSCVLPCRNEARSLARLMPRLLDELSALVQHWELILVDDGSTDDTPKLLLDWSRVEGVRVIQLSRNFGKEAALTAGLQAAAGDVVVTMDADGQHEPELIATLLQTWREGAELAYAQRRHRQNENLLKRAGTHLFYALLNCADRFEVPAGAGDFRLMDRCVVNALLALPELNRFLKGLYAWVGFRAVAVPYTPAPRLHGRSHFSFARLLRLSLDGLTSFTTLPLRAVSLAGFALAVVAFAYGAYLTVSYFLYGHHIDGWTTIVVALMLFSGIQLVSLGIVGEYVGRIVEEVKQRRLYVVRRELGRGLGVSGR